VAVEPTISAEDRRAAQVATILFAVPLIAAQAVVAARLWRWFVTPLGPDPISAVHAFGLMLIVGLLRPMKEPVERTMEETVAHIRLRALGIAFEFVLGLAAVTVMT
jgi:hypothetical protein